MIGKTPKVLVEETLISVTELATITGGQIISIPLELNSNDLLICFDQSDGNGKCSAESLIGDYSAGKLAVQWAYSAKATPSSR